MFKHLLLFSIITSILSASNWYNNFYPSIEAGLHLSSFNGTISNVNSTTNFKNDLNFKDTSSSYFTIGLKNNYKYMPSFYISYFSDIQEKDTTISSKKFIADAVLDANSSASTIIDYQVVNFVICEDFKIKGKKIKFLRWRFYPGDIEFDIGTNIKMIRWKIKLAKQVDAGSYPYWIEVKENILLPYIGFKYFYYNSRIYSNISALSLNKAKSLNYEIGFEYRLINNLYISASYLFEGFQATEERDTHKDNITFRTIGNKFSFKYLF